MQYELINPSDPYTFEADDFEVAALTVFSISTAYSAEAQDGCEGVPLFLFGGASEWYAERFGRMPDEGLTEKKLAVAKALESFMLGSFEDRRRYNAALEAIDDPEKRKSFMHEWQDGRSSMNNIGEYAHRLGKSIQLKAESIKGD